MMGPSHAMSGAAGFLLVAPTIADMSGHPLTTTQTLVGAAICAGAAQLPDIDEKNSTVSRSFGPVTVAISMAVNALSAAWMNLTKTSREPFVTDGHRGLTHTLLGMFTFSALLIIGFANPAWGKYVVIGTLFVLSGLAIRGLMGDWAKKQGWIIVTAVSAAAAVVAADKLPKDNYWWLSVTILCGLLAHGLGDMITKEGVPLAAPLRFRGKGWWEFTLPSFLRIRAGGAVEYGILLPLFTVITFAGVLAAFIGWGEVWPLLRSMVGK